MRTTLPFTFPLSPARKASLKIPNGVCLLDVDFDDTFRDQLPTRSSRAVVTCVACASAVTPYFEASSALGCSSMEMTVPPFFSTAKDFLYVSPATVSNTKS